MGRLALIWDAHSCLHFCGCFIQGESVPEWQPPQDWWRERVPTGQTAILLSNLTGQVLGTRQQVQGSGLPCGTRTLVLSFTWRDLGQVTSPRKPSLLCRTGTWTVLDSQGCCRKQA